MNDFFSTHESIVAATAPGRMDVMGGIADYSGSLLLQMPTKQTTTVTIQKRNDGAFHFRTQVTKKKTADFTIHLSAIKDMSLIAPRPIIPPLLRGARPAHALACPLAPPTHTHHRPPRRQRPYSHSHVPPGQKELPHPLPSTPANYECLTHPHTLTIAKRRAPRVCAPGLAHILVWGGSCGFPGSVLIPPCDQALVPALSLSQLSPFKQLPFRTTNSPGMIGASSRPPCPSIVMSHRRSLSYPSRLN